MKALLKLFVSKIFQDQNSLERLTVTVCPNCWGKQEYADKYVPYSKDNSKSNFYKQGSGPNNFISKIVSKHITKQR